MIPQRRAILSPAGFNPASIAGLQLWLKPESLANLAVFDPIDTWPDSSGNARGAVGIGTARPILIRLAGGQLGVQFDGVNDTLTTPAFTVNQPDTIIVAVQNQTADAAQHIYIDAVTLRQVIWTQATSINIYAGNTVPGVTTQTAQPRVISALFVGAAAEIWENGVFKVTGFDGGGPETGGFLIGASAAAGYHNGNIFEVLVYSGALPTADRQAVERYLGAKYGIPIA